jgi:photosystem II stability/assembly factor-like uncharacterized protein
VPTSKKLNAILFSTETEGWAVGDKGTILHTADAGVTWLAENSPTKNTLTDLARSKDGTIWAVGEWGTILKF